MDNGGFFELLVSCLSVCVLHPIESRNVTGIAGMRQRESTANADADADDASLLHFA